MESVLQAPTLLIRSVAIGPRSCYLWSCKSLEFLGHRARAKAGLPKDAASRKVRKRVPTQRVAHTKASRVVRTSPSVPRYRKWILLPRAVRSMAAPAARRQDYDYLIKLLLIGDSGMMVVALPNRL